MINERKYSGENDEKRDLLSNLVNANEEFTDDGEQRLGEVELVGAESGLGLLAHLLIHLSFRKHFRILRCWTRGEDTLVNTDDHLISVV